MDGRVGSRKGLKGAGGLGGTQGQGSSISGRAEGLGGAVMGEGRLGENPPPPSCREGFSVPLPEGDTQACLISIYRVFFKFGATVSPRGPPSGPVAEMLPTRGQGSIPSWTQKIPCAATSTWCSQINK